MENEYSIIEIITDGFHQFCVDFLREIFSDMRYWEFALYCPNSMLCLNSLSYSYFSLKDLKKDELGNIIETVNLYFSHFTQPLWNFANEKDCSRAVALLHANIAIAIQVAQVVSISLFRRFYSLIS
jgi:hypothetical protein